MDKGNENFKTTQLVTINKKRDSLLRPMNSS